MLEKIKHSSDYSQVLSSIPTGKAEIFLTGSAGNLRMAAINESGFIEELGQPYLPEIHEYSSDSAYLPQTCLTYQGGGYQVLSATSAGESPDTNPEKFFCFVSSGSDGISPTVSVTSVTSGAVIVTSDAQGETSATILHGHLEGASQVVSSLTSGAIMLENEAIPVAVRTSAGNLYPLEKGTISISSGAWQIDPAAYLAYDNVSSFAGPWTVYFAGGLPETQTIHSGGSSIVPQEHQVYRHDIVASETVSVDSSSLTSSMCMTFELWLDMPSPAVSFTLPAFTWVDGAVPDFDSANTRYVLVVRWNGTKFLACSAYEESLS